MSIIEVPMAGGESGGEPMPTQPKRWTRFLPLALVAAGGVTAFLLAGDKLDFQTIAEHRDSLIGWRDETAVLAALTFVAVYVGVVLFSVPGALWVSITGGFLFGTALGTVLNVVSATTGATLLFLIARSSLGALLRDRAAGWVDRAAQSIERNQISFLLMMRLAPGMPFFVVNLIPAFFRVSLPTYVWTTFVGIIPAAIVYTSFGAGIGEVIDRGEVPDMTVFRDPEIVLPLLGLMLLSLVPLVVRRLRARH
jgi:uncharacterized membrane protein YdjX (TVP38/TMEM64 family)